MDELEKSLKRKKIRTILITVLAIVCIAGSIVGVKIEKTSKVKAAAANDATTVAEDSSESDETTSEKATQTTENITNQKEFKEDNTNPTNQGSNDIKSVTMKQNSVATTAKSSTPTTAGATMTVYIEITCDELAKDTSVVDSSLRKYIPKDGTILAKTPYTCSSGTTVYDVLKATCKANNIQLDSSKSVTGAYIKGINYLYEKAAGSNSGWKYSVNGSYPSYSCSSKSVTLKNGDIIAWEYSLTL